MKRGRRKKLKMAERRVLVKVFAAEYRKVRKKRKGVILDQVVEATGYERHYAARLLRNHGKTVVVAPGVLVKGDVGCRIRRRRQRIYGEDVKRVLIRLWELLDYLCGKRLVGALPETIKALERHGELKLPEELRRKLLCVSAATIDRLLASEKRKLQLKGRSLTKPGSLLRQQIPIRTFADWDEARPGFVEMDLVAHEGGDASGDFAYTLDLTDVSTGWTELAAVKNRAQVWVFEALQEIRQRLPFPLLGLDSDNGGEFINHHLKRYCEAEQISFTRSRPYRKNDNCFVEQKNYSVVRRHVGYGRYDTEVELQLLNQLYEYLRLYVNFFLPSQKLKEKTRRGSRVQKRYHKARTPYRRVLDSKQVPGHYKKKLRAHYQTLNPAELHRQIRRLEEALLWEATKKRRATAVDGAVPGGKASGFPTDTWKTPAEFPTPTTASTTTTS
jgi:hypothetical protein